MKLILRLALALLLPAFVISALQSSPVSASSKPTTTTLHITSVFTADDHRNNKAQFNNGDFIFYVVYVQNNSGLPMTVTFHYESWLSSDRSKEAIDQIVRHTIPTGLSGWGWSSTLPDNALSGQYTHRVRVTDQTNIS